MPDYYCFISGLPELSFHSAERQFGLSAFLGQAKPVLDPLHMDWVNRLVMEKGHKSVLNFFTGKESGIVPHLPFETNWFDPENEKIHLLPEYLQNFAAIHRSGTKDLTPGQLEKELTEDYFSFLNSTGNEFIMSWASFNMNIRNYIAAKTWGENEPLKKEELLKGNDFSLKLQEFDTGHKEVQVDWPLAAKIDKILEDTNIHERERSLDRLRWEKIESLNLFNYFSIEVILGYTLKLLIIERWENIDQPEERAEIEGIVNKKVEAHFIHNPFQS